MEKGPEQMTLGQFEISPRQRQIVEKMGMHEAGHFVVARKLGFEVGETTICLIDIYDNHDCSVLMDTAQRLSDISEIARFLEKRILVLFAGAMAQSLVDGKVDFAAVDGVMKAGEGREDEQKAAELIHLLRNIRHADTADDNEFQEAVTALSHDLWEKARVLVESEFEAISALGNHFATEVRVGGKYYVFSKEQLDAFLTQD